MGFSRFVLCGHSTGCQKAIYYQYRAQDRRVAGLVLLGPADDYNGYKKEFGKDFEKILAKCKKLIKDGKGNTQLPEASFFSASRMASLIDQKNVEARLLDYNGKLAEFGKIRIPILAVFGSEEEHRLMPVKKYLEILDAKSNSRRYSGLVIYGANHGFYWKEDELLEGINKWISGL
jgi:pimeloyl-ACP methyl ester carboxylesterase